MLNLPKHPTLDIDKFFLFQYVNNSISLIKANVKGPSYKEGPHVWLERNPILPSRPYLPKKGSVLPVRNPGKNRFTYPGHYSFFKSRLKMFPGIVSVRASFF